MKKNTAIGIISVLAIIAIVLGVLYFTNNADKTKQLADLNAVITEKAGQIETLNADVAEKTGQIETLNADVAEKAGQIETLNADIAEKAGQIETLKADVEGKSAQIARLEADLYESQHSEKTRYEAAQALMAKGQFAEAADQFSELGSYEDATKLSMYCRAAAAGENGDYKTATSTFKLLEDYKESKFMISYYEARQYESEVVSGFIIYWGKLFEAAKLYDSLHAFRDSAERAEACRKAAYDYAVEWAEEGAYSDADRVFERLGEYSDSATLRKYYEAFSMEKNKDYAGASAKFAEIGIFKDANEQKDLVLQRGYLYAKELMDSGKYDDALVILSDLKGYKDVDSLLANDVHLIAATRKKKMQITGSCITFGTYPQTADGTDQTPIEWIVLKYDEKNNKSLLLSKYCLDAVPYNSEIENTSWEKSSLRAWLNSQFLNKAFSSAEQSVILITDVDNSSWQGYKKWSQDGGNDTQDRIFLLSYAEANRYLRASCEDNDNTQSRAALTAYAISRNAFTSNITVDGGPAGRWWLRSPGMTLEKAARVYGNGSIGHDNVNSSEDAIRPAIWVDLNSLNF